MSGESYVIEFSKGPTTQIKILFVSRQRSKRPSSRHQKSSCQNPQIRLCSPHDYLTRTRTCWFVNLKSARWLQSSTRTKNLSGRSLLQHFTTLHSDHMIDKFRVLVTANYYKHHSYLGPWLTSVWSGAKSIHYYHHCWKHQSAFSLVWLRCSCHRLRMRKSLERDAIF